MSLSAVDWALGLLLLAVCAYLNRDYIASKRKKNKVVAPERILKTQRIAPDEPKVAIYFGSQTGAAEDYARELFRNLTRADRSNVCEQLNEFSASKTEGKLVIFVVSTFGCGEFPDNAKGFAKFIDLEPSKIFHNIQFCVFGLGSLKYENFNAAAKSVDSCLERLGAKRVLAPIYCDDKESDEQFSDWQRLLFAKIDVQLSSTAQTVVEKRKEKREFFNAVISATKRHETNLHLELKTNVSYNAGDYVALWPSNSKDLVDRLISRLKLTRVDEEICIKSDNRIVFDWCSVSNVISHYVDLFAPLQDHVIKLLEKSMYKEKSAIESNTECNIVEYLERYPSISVSVEQLLLILPRIKRRYYSIASRGSGRIKLLISTKEYNGKIGFAANMLINAAIGEKLRLQVVSSRFKLPPKIHTPLVMVCTGTGIAPFLGFLEHLSQMNFQGESWLFVGVQTETDLSCRGELDAHVASGVLRNLHVVCSRQEPKEYVQHRMQQHRESLCALIKNGASVYVCGNKRAATDIAQWCQDNVECFAQLKAKGRYIVDAWG